jgi:hypothetical protein
MTSNERSPVRSRSRCRQFPASERILTRAYDHPREFADLQRSRSPMTRVFRCISVGNQSFRIREMDVDVREELKKGTRSLRSSALGCRPMSTRPWYVAWCLFVRLLPEKIVTIRILRRTIATRACVWHGIHFQTGPSN